MATTRIDFSPAIRLFMVSNSPIFLFEQLMQCHTTHALAASKTSNELLKFLQSSVSRAPRTKEAHVKPYVLLAALALKGDAAKVKAAAAFSSPHHPWYGVIANAAYDRAKPTTVISKQVNSIISAPRIIDEVTTSSTTIELY